MLLLVAAATQLGACGRADVVHPTLSELRALPAATSHYPGSVEVASFDHDSDANLFSKEQGIIRSYWCAPAELPTVRDWFSQTLAEAGWRPLEPARDSSSDADTETVASWVRGDHTFDLFRLSKSYLGRRRAAPGDGGIPAACVTGYAIEVS